MKIHYLQHVPFEGLASIELWAITQNHSLSATRFYDNEPLPSVEDIDWLIVMGGPMNIYEDDRHPWLNQEKWFIEQAIEQDKTVKNCGDELVEGKYIQHSAEMLSRTSNFRAINSAMNRILNNLSS